MQEVDRTLKRVQEGIDEFDAIWDKVYSATTAQLQEKYESELKKELKKLQRSRDQIKGWLTNAEIKDKTELLEARKVRSRHIRRPCLSRRLTRPPRRPAAHRDEDGAVPTVRTRVQDQGVLERGAVQVQGGPARGAARERACSPWLPPPSRPWRCGAVDRKDQDETVAGRLHRAPANRQRGVRVRDREDPGQGQAHARGGRACTLAAPRVPAGSH